MEWAFKGALNANAFKENMAVVFTNFSANSLFHIAKNDCAALNHGVLDNFHLLHSPENLTVKLGTEERNVRFNHSDAWHFLSSAAEKSKSSVSHNTYLACIMSQYEHLKDLQLGMTIISG